MEYRDDISTQSWKPIDFTKYFLTEIRSERIADIVEFTPQNGIMPRMLSTDATTLSVRYLVEALQKPTPNAPFKTINDTHHTALIIMEELFNIIPKAAEKQSTNRHNGRWKDLQEVSAEPDQVRAPVTH